MLELDGEFAAGAAAARDATEDDPDDWQTGSCSRGSRPGPEAEAAVDAYRKRRTLNPRSPLFAQ